MKVIVVGGVAAGASAAARLRRLDEQAEIILLEKGPDISYANCGLPYHVGGVIRDRERLSVMPPAKFAAWFNVDVRTGSEALAIDRAAKTVKIRSAVGEYTESYDKLLLATGSSPSGVTDPDKPSRVMRLWTLADMDRVIARVQAGAKSAIVVGAGFIGLEAAENLREKGLAVTVVELGAHVLAPLDREMAQPIQEELASIGIDVRLGRKVVNYDERPDGLTAELDDGNRLDADFAIVSIGVRPQSELAKAAGLDIGPRGHIVVDEHMRTSDPDIYAAGDVIEVVDPVFGGKTAIALAGPRR